MARAAIAPPSRGETARNITQSEDNGPRYINFRVDPDKFEEIKIAAIKARMKLGEYLVHAHDTFQASQKG